MREARERRDQQTLHAERRPVALRVLEQLVGLRDPDRLAPAVQPVVENDAGGLATLAGAGPVTEHEAATEADGVRCVVAGGRDEVEGLVYRPGASEIVTMRLASIDDRLKLGVGQNAIADEVCRQPWPIARLRRRDRGHRGRLHQLGRVRLRTVDPDRLEPVFFVDGVAEARALGRRPICRLISEVDGFGIGNRGLDRLCSGPPQITAHSARRCRR
ncbi:hypothetical protein ABIF38_002889 [Bradyrhizobium japonicum]